MWTRPGPAPGRTAPAFSREEITRAAIELADSDGLGAVSMRRIADRIGCSPTSIYWYVSDKSELYELMVDAVRGEIDLRGQLIGEWRADLSTVAWSSLAAYRRHLWFSQLGIHPVPGPGTLRYAAIVLESLAGCGLDDATTINVLATLNNYIFGFIQRERAWQSLVTRDTTAQTRWARAAAAGGAGRPSDDPAADRDLSARLSLASDESFAFGLGCFLDGIGHLVAGHDNPGAAAQLLPRPRLNREAPYQGTVFPKRSRYSRPGLSPFARRTFTTSGTASSMA